MQKETCLPMSKNVGCGGEGLGRWEEGKASAPSLTVMDIGMQGAVTINCDFINNALVNKLVY